MFDVPAAFDKFDGQPVEQFGVGRPFALRPHVVEPLREAGAEIHFPHPVDEHSRGQRVIARDDPVGKIEPCEPLAGDLRLRQKRGHGG